jgi:hypothetical protein
VRREYIPYRPLGSRIGAISPFRLNGTPFSYIKRGSIASTYSFQLSLCFLSRNKAIDTLHNKLQAFRKLLELRIIGSAGRA